MENPTKMTRRFTSPVVLLGAGRLYEPDKPLISNLNLPIICADGGFQAAGSLGVKPELIIGDRDSVRPEDIGNTPYIYDSDQNTTDFDKSLAHVTAPMRLCFGFWGKRLDHSLAALSSLTRSTAKGAILVGEEDICFCAPAEFQLELPAGTPIGFYPLTDVTAKSSGLKYPLDGLTLSPTGRLGTSNETTGNLELSDVNGKLLVILPRDQLSSAAKSFGVNIPAD